jgi:hypothetical protein
MNTRDENRITELNKGYINPNDAYQYIDAIRASVNTISFGLGAANEIPSPTSLLVGISVEGICAALAFITLVSEFINIVEARITGVTEKTNNGFVSGHSLYMGFRLILILASVAGIGLIASEYPYNAQQNTTAVPSNNSTSGARTILGIALMGVSIFGSRCMNAKYKQVDKEKKEIQKDEKENEMEIKMNL